MYRPLLLSCLLLLTAPLATAKPKADVLSYRWEQAPQVADDDLTTVPIRIGDQRLEARCRTESEVMEERLQDSVYQARLCYYEQALFQVELYLDPNRLRVFEEVLREKYGEPERVADARPGGAPGQRERPAPAAAGSNPLPPLQESATPPPSQATAPKGTPGNAVRQGNRPKPQPLHVWETPKTRIELDGRILRYRHQPTLDRIREEARERDASLKGELEDVL